MAPQNRNGRKVTLTVLLIACFALVIFLSIPVPGSEYARNDHVAGCEPSPDPYPLIIHQIWLNYSAFPPSWQEPIDHCRQLNLNHTYYLWSRDDIENFLQREYPWFLETYHSYTYNVQRVDAARLFLLHFYGGVYIDIDIHCVMPFEKQGRQFRKYDVILSRGSTFGVSNHIMAAKARHPYIQLALDNLADFNRWFVFPYITIMYSAGPGFLTQMLRRYECKEQIYVFPPEPEHNIYYENMHGGSWHTWDTKVIDVLKIIHRVLKATFSIRVLGVAAVVALTGGAIWWLNRRYKGGCQRIRYSLLKTQEKG